MSSRTSLRLSLALVAALAAALTPAATASAADTRLSSGSVEGLAVDGKPFAQAAFQNLHAEFDECGELPNETSCDWFVEVVVHYGPAGCFGEASAVLWSSGPIAGNGTVDSGPQSITLSCPGQGLTLSQGYKKTYGPWEGPGDPPLIYSTGFTRSVALLTESLAAAEQRIIDESPAARVAPMPLPRRFEIGSDCRSLTVGETRYRFRFKGIGCRTASALAAAAEHGEPRGYRCTRRGGGGARCARIGQPKKFVEWHLPRSAKQRA